MDQPLPRPQRKIHRTEEGEFSYLVWDQAGPAAPALHFAHATGFHGGVYQRLLAPLADRLRIWALDLRGHGRSPAYMEPMKLKSWDRYRDDLERFVEQEIGEPVFFAGHSLGGITSLSLASKRPDLARGLILIDPVMLTRPLTALVLSMKTLGIGYKIPIAARALKRRSGWKHLEGMRASYVGKRIFRTWPEGWLDDYLADGTNVLKDGSVELTCTPLWEAKTFSVTEHRCWKRLRGVSCPITVLYGGDSDTFLPKAAKRFANARPDDRLLRLEGATHFVPMERAEKVGEEICRMIFSS